MKTAPLLSSQVKIEPARHLKKSGTAVKLKSDGRPAGWGLNALRRIIALFIRRPEITGLGNVAPHHPAIFVANHLGAVGPLVLGVHFPLSFVPWVAHEATDPALSKAHIRQHFVERNLKVGPPLSRIIAAPLAAASVSLMRRLGVIPVYHKTRRLRETVELSVAALQGGRNLLVFPEVDESVDPSCCSELHRGFVNIARAFYRRTMVRPVFYPVSIDPRRNRVHVGPGTPFDPTVPMGREKERITGYLLRSIRARLPAPRPLAARFNRTP